jgi:hypothetical protein
MLEYGSHLQCDHNLFTLTIVFYHLLWYHNFAILQIFNVILLVNAHIERATSAQKKARVYIGNEGTSSAHQLVAESPGLVKPDQECAAKIILELLAEA